MKKLTMSVMAAVIIAAFSNLAQAELDIPASGTFDIITDPCDPCSTPGISFNPLPYSGSSVYLWPFASEDGSTSPFPDYNLGRVWFSEGTITLTDEGEQQGDLGIRILNLSGTTQTFEPSVLTLDFIGHSFDVYLPGFTFEWGDELFLWVAQSGATYYAHNSKGFSDAPNMLAIDAMIGGGEYLARTPEPATAVLFGLGALLLGRRRKTASN